MGFVKIIQYLIQRLVAVPFVDPLVERLELLPIQSRFDLCHRVTATSGSDPDRHVGLPISQMSQHIFDRPLAHHIGLQQVFPAELSQVLLQSFAFGLEAFDN